MIPLLVSVILLVIWELGVWGGAVPTLFFPAPSTIVQTLVRITLNGELLLDLGATLARLVLGLLLGGSLGVVLGLAMGWSRTVHTVAEPFVAATHPLPKVALLPLVLVLFGIGEQSKIVLIALAAFFPMVINTMAGVRQIDTLYLEVAAQYGARGLALMRRVVLPGSLPMILAGFRLALNAALVITITVEIIMANRGLGSTIWLAWQTMRMEELYATLVVIALLGVCANWLLGRLAKAVSPWQM